MNKILSILVALAIAFAAGRYSVKSKTIEENQTTKTKTDTTIVTVKEPNGKETTTTVIKERETTKKELNITETPKKAVLNVALLGAYDFRSNDSNQPIYGVSISKEFIGPITLGIFGMTNGIAGLSIGANF